MAERKRARDFIPQFAKEHNLRITSFMGGRHNKGSLHGLGRAFDFDHEGISDKKFKELQALVAKYGGRLLDERVRPKGQAVWGGPHFHAEFPDFVDLGAIAGSNIAPIQGALMPPVPSIDPVKQAPVKEAQTTYSLIDGKPYYPQQGQAVAAAPLSPPTPSVLAENKPEYNYQPQPEGNKTMPFWAALGAFMKPIAQNAISTALTGSPMQQVGGQGQGMLAQALPAKLSSRQTQPVGQPVPIPDEDIQLRGGLNNTAMNLAIEEMLRKKAGGASGLSGGFNPVAQLMRGV